jgi:hypothetical protein
MREIRLRLLEPTEDGDQLVATVYVPEVPRAGAVLMLPEGRYQVREWAPYWLFIGTPPQLMSVDLWVNMRTER